MLRRRLSQQAKRSLASFGIMSASHHSAPQDAPAAPCSASERRVVNFELASRIHTASGLTSGLRRAATAHSLSGALCKAVLLHWTNAFICCARAASNQYPSGGDISMNSKACISSCHWQCRCLAGMTYSQQQITSCIPLNVHQQCTRQTTLAFHAELPEAEGDAGSRLPVRTSIRTYHAQPSHWERAQERKRRAVLGALGTSSGFLAKRSISAAASRPCVVTSQCLPWSRAGTATAGRPGMPIGALPPLHSTHDAALRDAIRDRLIATPTAAQPELRAIIAQHNKLRPPSRSHTIAQHRRGVRTAAAGPRPPRSPAPPLPSQHVDVADIGTVTIPNPMQCTTFSELWSICTIVYAT